MNGPLRRFFSTLAAFALLAAISSPVSAEARERRASARSDSPRATSRATPAQRPQRTTQDRTPVARVSPRQTAAGHASYGHGSRGGYGWYPGPGWYGYPWWSYDLYWGWGWPAWGYAPPRYLEGNAPLVLGDRGPALLEIDVSPRRATVNLDGEQVGRAKDWDGRWDRLPVDPGDRVLTFDAPGYQTLRVRLDAAAGGLYRLSYDLAKGEGIDSRSTTAERTAAAPRARERMAPPDATEPREGLARGFLRIRVTPADAAVYLDGAYFARADELARLRGAVPLAVGNHTVEIVRPGHESAKVDVEVVEGTPVEVAVDLVRSR